MRKKVKSKRTPTYIKWKNRISKALLAAKAAQGDNFAGTQLALDTAKEWLTTNFPGAMRQRQRPFKAKAKRKPRRRRRNNFMGVSRIPVRRVVPYAASSGSEHRWYYNVKLSHFYGMFTSQYQEFRMANIRVRYLPNNSTNETGLYAAVMLDREGFGGYGAATAVKWFTTIGAMPGARIRARYTPTTFVWRPTEPSAREWCTYKQDITYCTVYICNNGLETEELGGMIEITGTLIARGLYYNAVVTAIARADPVMFPHHSVHSSSSLEFEQLDISSSPRPLVRCQSFTSFQTLG